MVLGDCYLQELYMAPMAQNLHIITFVLHLLPRKNSTSLQVQTYIVAPYHSTELIGVTLSPLLHYNFTPQPSVVSIFHVYFVIYQLIYSLWLEYLTTFQSTLDLGLPFLRLKSWPWPCFPLFTNIIYINKRKHLTYF